MGFKVRQVRNLNSEGRGEAYGNSIDNSRARGDIGGDSRDETSDWVDKGLSDRFDEERTTSGLISSSISS